MTVEEVRKEIRKDVPFYQRSGGGVTVTGGEALMQYEFVRELFKSCKEDGMNTAIETCGCVLWNAFLEVSEWTDYFLFDIKHVDQKKFAQVTGGNLKTILSNFEKLLNLGQNVEVRIPFIPGFNSDPDTFGQICAYLNQCGVGHITVLPFHKLGTEKYRSLNRDYAYQDQDTFPGHCLEEAKEIAKSYQLECSFYRS